MNNKKKVLIVVTSHSELGNTGEKTGYYLPEVSHPADVFLKAGFDIDVASPQGGKAPMDPPYEKADRLNQWFLNDPSMVHKMENTLRPEQVNLKQYAAIFFAGGTGVMWDYRGNAGLQELVREMYELGGIVAAVCHGPAALVDVKLSSGEYLVTGKKVAGFSDAEEDAHGTTQIVPFLLETALKERGALYSKAGLWEEHIKVDGRLITGQNPASAAQVARKTVELLATKAHAKN